MASFQSSRLHFAPLALSDLPDLFALRSDPQVMQYWDWPGDSSPQQTREALEACVAEMSSGEAFHWSVRTQKDSQFVGCCDLSSLRPSDGPDVGFMLARRHWGQGFGHEVLQSLIAQASAMLLESLEARIHTENVRSNRLLIRCGFAEVRTVAKYEIRPGVYCSCTWFYRAI